MKKNNEILSPKIKPLILAIDFDDTIAEVGGLFPDIKGLRAGAKEAINRLYDDGHYIIIWTCREGLNQHKAEALLYENGIRYHAINRHCPLNEIKYNNNTRKIGADIYIDDKCLMGLPDWPEVYRIVNEKAIKAHPRNDEYREYTDLKTA